VVGAKAFTKIDERVSFLSEHVYGWFFEEGIFCKDDL
jgi:hypothetical protein